MAHRTIPQRELRNDIAAVLREAESGTEFTVTVRGRPVAKLGPLTEESGPRRYVDRETLRRFFEKHPPDHAWAADLAEMREAEEPIDDPWNDG
jgi:prevent-host-death family protein